MKTESYLTQGTVSLRAPEPEDLDVMYRMENDNRMWAVGGTTTPFSRYGLRTFIEHSTGDLYTDKQARFMIEVHGKTVGAIDLFRFEPLYGRAEVGIAMLQDERGKGYGRIALELLCQYAFNLLHLHQLYAVIPVDNSPSLSLFAACGFSGESRLRDWIKREDGFADAVLVQKMGEKP